MEEKHYIDKSKDTEETDYFVRTKKAAINKRKRKRHHAELKKFIGHRWGVLGVGTIPLQNGNWLNVSLLQDIQVGPQTESSTGVSTVMRMSSVHLRLYLKPSYNPPETYDWMSKEGCLLRITLLFVKGRTLGDKESYCEYAVQPRWAAYTPNGTIPRSDGYDGPPMQPSVGAFMEDDEGHSRYSVLWNEFIPMPPWSSEGSTDAPFLGKSYFFNKYIPLHGQELLRKKPIPEISDPWRGTDDIQLYIWWGNCRYVNRLRYDWTLDWQVKWENW